MSRNYPTKVDSYPTSTGQYSNFNTRFKRSDQSPPIRLKYGESILRCALQPITKVTVNSSDNIVIDPIDSLKCQDSWVRARKQSLNEPTEARVPHLGKRRHELTLTPAATDIDVLKPTDNQFTTGIERMESSNANNCQLVVSPRECSSRLDFPNETLGGHSNYYQERQSSCVNGFHRSGTCASPGSDVSGAGEHLGSGETPTHCEQERWTAQKREYLGFNELNGLARAPASPDQEASGVEVQTGKKPRSKYSPCRPPLLPPCRVCGDRASGFHYGVNTCEACKGFFRRSICKTEPYVCAAAGHCKPVGGKRTACSHCRFKRCIEVGMSKTAIKTGRYTHELRSQNILEVKRLEKQSQIQDSPPGRHDSVEEPDRAAIDSTHAHRDEVNYTEYKNGLLRRMVVAETLGMLMTGQTLLFENLDECFDQVLMDQRQHGVYARYQEQRGCVGTSIKDEKPYNHICQLPSTTKNDVVVKLEYSQQDGRCEHSEISCAGKRQCCIKPESINCSVSGDGFNQILFSSNCTPSEATSTKTFASPSPSSSLSSSAAQCEQCSLDVHPGHANGTTQEKMKAEVMSKILKDIEQGVNGMLAFSSSIPGFEGLHKNDKAALIKSSRFDVWFIGHIRCLNVDLRVGACEWQFHADELALVWGKNLVDLVFKMARQGQSLDLSKEETAALRAICLTSADRCSPLSNAAEVERIHDLMWDVLRMASEKRHTHFNKYLPKVINFLMLLREFGVKFESISSQLMLDWSVLKSNPLLLSVFLM